MSDADTCERCDDAPVLGRVEIAADYDGAMERDLRLCEGCVRKLGEWFRAGDLTNPDTEQIEYVVPESELYEVYALLADATEAAAAGDTNECASKAAAAKEQLLAVHEDGDLLHEVDA